MYISEIMSIYYILHLETSVFEICQYQNTDRDFRKINTVAKVSRTIQFYINIYFYIYKGYCIECTRWNWWMIRSIVWHQLRKRIPNISSCCRTHICHGTGRSRRGVSTIRAARNIRDSIETEKRNLIFFST